MLIHYRQGTPDPNAYTVGQEHPLGVITDVRPVSYGWAVDLTVQMPDPFPEGYRLRVKEWY